MTKNKAAPSDAWGMACAVLSAMEQTLEKAREEFREARIAAGGNPFGAGVGAKANLVETLENALRPLRHEMHLHAKANGLLVPMEGKSK